MATVRSSLMYVCLVPVLAVLLFGMIWAYTIYDRVAFLDSDYGAWAAKLKMVKGCSIGRVVILGDSRASAAFLPSGLDMQATNLALTGSTPVETFYEVEDILRCRDRPSAVILAFAPPQFENIDWLWQHSVRYGQLDKRQLDEIADADRRYPSNQLYHGNFGAEPSPGVKNWLYANHFPPYDFASLIAAGVGMRRRANLLIENETLAAGGQHVVGTPAACATEAGPEIRARHFSPNPLMTHYFKRILTVLNTNKIAVVLANTPYSNLTGDQLDLSYKLDFEKFITSIAEEYPWVVVAQPLFLNAPNCYFGDRHHLNENGARLFSTAERPKLERAVAEAIAKL